MLPRLPMDCTALLERNKQLTDRFDPIDRRLMEELSYPPAGATLIIAKLRGAAPLIQEAFWQWWEDGILPDLTVAGITFQTLVTDHGMNPIAALLTIDWLIRDPNAALRSLKKGHDIHK